MTDREAFEAWHLGYLKKHRQLPTKQEAWQAALASERAKPNEWKEAVIEKLIVSCIYQDKHDDDPMRALNDLLEWETQIALDPLVSCQAQALIDRGAASERAKQAEPVARIHVQQDDDWVEWLMSRQEIGDILEVYAAPPADDEAVRLLREAQRCLKAAKRRWAPTTTNSDADACIEANDAYLARVRK